MLLKYAAREKSIRNSHPSRLHLWWAGRLLAACRSMLLALLLPDPCDPHCPEEFKTKAHALFQQAMLPGKKPTTDAELRARLLHFIGEFANWDLASDRTYLEIACGLVKAAHPERPRWLSIRSAAAARATAASAGRCWRRPACSPPSSTGSNASTRSRRSN